MRSTSRSLVVLMALAMGGTSVLLLTTHSEQFSASAEETEEGESPKDKPSMVEVAGVAVGPIATHIQATANLSAERKVKIVAETQGRIVAIDVEVGQQVRAGQRLLGLTSESQRLQLQRAEIELRGSDKTHGRSKHLADRGLVSSEELDKLGTEHALAIHKLAEARHALAQTKIVAPFEGEITRRPALVGQYVRPGDELFDIVDPTSLVATLHVPERDALRLELGRPAEMTLQAAPDVRFGGVIDRIGSVVDEATGTVEVRIVVRNAPAEVRSGSFVSIELVRTREMAALLVPREALLRSSQGETHVFVVEGDVARRREVKVGAESPRMVEISSGVAPGEIVIVSGHGALADGRPIRIMKRDQPDRLGVG